MIVTNLTPYNKSNMKPWNRMKLESQAYTFDYEYVENRSRK